MRVQHTPHSLPSFPVYSSAFISSHELVLGGGGGASRSGIKNKLRLYNVKEDRSIDLIDELELARDEDAPMSMAAHPESKAFVCGVNSPPEQLDKGQNENCRIYCLNNTKLGLANSYGTLTSGNLEDYQKVTVISPDGKLVLVAGNNDFTLLSYPFLSPVASSISTGKNDIYDATFTATSLVVTTTANLLVYALPKHPSFTPQSPSKSKKKGKQKAQPIFDLELLRTVEIPASLGGPTGCNFRAARYHPHDDQVLYTVTNTLPLRSRKNKSSSRQAFICKWDTESWTVSKARKVGDKGLTCFDVSPNGKFLGYGSSDYSTGLLDAATLNPVVTILKAHEFPPTTLKFNPTSTLFISGSADNSVRVVTVPESTPSSAWSIFVLLFLAMLVILIAVAVQNYIVSPVA